MAEFNPKSDVLFFQTWIKLLMRLNLNSGYIVGYITRLPQIHMFVTFLTTTGCRSALISPNYWYLGEGWAIIGIWACSLNTAKGGTAKGEDWPK